MIQEIDFEAWRRELEGNGLKPTGEGPPPLGNRWPEPMAGAAFHGLAGEVVRLTGPHTEADPAAILVQFLAAYGNVIGRSAHWQVEADTHYLNLFAALVGETSKARKGTSWGRVRGLFHEVDPEWAQDRTHSGLASGEGLKWCVRDPVMKVKPVRPRGRASDEMEKVCEDAGVNDKRLLVVEAEFASLLRVASREGNTLSATVRNAWDTGKLEALTRHDPVTATGAHVSIVGHITRDELLRYLDTTEVGNGFANRFLWTCVRRSKCLPEGGGLIDRGEFTRLIERLKAAVEFGKTAGLLQRDGAAAGLWREVYPDLSAGGPGLLGAMIARAEAQVMRLAAIYALLDRSQTIRVEHLKAGLAVWDYCDYSARFIFGDALGDPVADELLRAVKAAGSEGMTRTEIRDHFHRHAGAGEVNRAVTALLERRLVGTRQENTGGRPVEIVYYLATKAT